MNHGNQQSFRHKQLALRVHGVTKCVLAGVSNVKKPIWILMLLVNGAHQRSCWWQNIINKDKHGLLGRKLDALANDVDKLTDG